MIDPDKTKTPGQNIAASSMEKAKSRTDEFVREMRYKTLLQGGLNPGQAANMMGVKLRSQDRFRAADILKMIVKGRKKP